MKQSHCQIRLLKWLLPHYLTTGLVVLAFPVAFTQTKVETLSLNSFKVSCSFFKLTKRELHPSIHNQMPWSNDWTELYWTCWPKLSMTSKAIGLSNFRMLWWHFELQCMNRQITHPSFFFLAKILTSPLIFSTLRQNNPTRSLCINLFNKNVLTFNEIAKQQASIFKLLNCEAMFCIILNCMAPDTSQVTMFGYIVLLPPKDWVPNFHPRAKVSIKFHSVSTTLHIKSKTQLTKRRPSFIMTVKCPSFNFQKNNNFHGVNQISWQSRQANQHKNRTPLFTNIVTVLKFCLTKFQRALDHEVPFSPIFCKFCPRKSHPRIFCCKSKTSILGFYQNHSL